MDTPAAATPAGAQPTAQTPDAPAPKAAPSTFRAEKTEAERRIFGRGALASSKPSVAAPVVETKPTPPPQREEPAPKPAPAVEAKKAPEPPKPPEEKKPDAPRKLKLKVDGVEEEHEEAEVIRRAQKASAADKRFAEASKAKKEAAEEVGRARALLEMAMKDPIAFLKDPRLKVDAKATATKFLQEQIQAEIEAEQEKTLSPEAKELRALKRKLEEEASTKTKAEHEAAEKARAERLESEKNALGNSIVECMKAATHLPQDADTAKLVVAEIRRNLIEGRPYDVADIVERLDRAEGARLAKRLVGYKPDKLHALLTDEWLKAFRDHDVAALRTKRQAVDAPQHTQPQVTEQRTQRTDDSPPVFGRGGEVRGHSEADLRARLLGLGSGISNAPVPRDQRGRFAK